METTELVEALRQKARECRQQARRLVAAAELLLEEKKPPGRPVNPKRDLLEAFKRSGLMYAQLAQKCGVSYRYVSWVIRGVKERPVLEARIREVLAAHTKDAT
jgi:hypothetical protein